MELVIKHFSELTNEELYDILKARVDVFVVEQKCPYPEIDGKDKDAYHMILRDERGIAAYLRVLKSGVSFPEPALGRILTTRRGEEREYSQRGDKVRRRKARRGKDTDRSAGVRAGLL